MGWQGSLCAEWVGWLLELSLENVHIDCPFFYCADYPGEESYQPRDYLAATMQFMPGHFACDAVWSTIIHVHSRLKMGPNMGVARGG